MTTSGEYGVTIDNFDLFDEAFERAGLDPAAVTDRHLKSARRSVRFMFADWSTKPGVPQFRIERVDHTTTAGENSFALDAQYLNVVEGYLTRGTTTTPMVRLSRDEYETITDKSIRGRPTQFFTDKQRDAVTVRYWQAAENDTDVLALDCVRMHEDLGTMKNSPDVVYGWLEAMASGLSARLSQKFAPDRYLTLLGEAEVAYRNAKNDAGDGGDLTIHQVYRRHPSSRR